MGKDAAQPTAENVVVSECSNHCPPSRAADKTESSMLNLSICRRRLALFMMVRVN